MEAQIQLIAELAEQGQLEELVKQVRGLEQHFGQNKDQFLQAINSASSHNRFNETILHACCFAGRLECVRFLLEIGCDPLSTVSVVESTPLHSASAGGHTEIVRILLETQPIAKRAEYVNKITNSRFTAVRCALEREYYEVAQVLVEWGAQLNIPISKKEFQSCQELYDSLWMKNRPSMAHDNQLESEVISINGLSIQIASDLHLEFYSEDQALPYRDIITPSAPILALLGDIGLPLSANRHYERFLHHMADQFQLVLVVAGNHEFYNHENKPYPEIQAKIQSICDSHPRLKYMNRTSLLINGVRILGCTLWSYIPEHAHLICEYSLNDYRRINGPGGEPFTAAMSTEWFEKDKQWIEQQVRQSMNAGEGSVVILTHHTPSFFGTSSRQFETDPHHHYAEQNPRDQRWTNCCFSSDLEHLFRNKGSPGNSNVRLWAFGHTHWNCDRQVFGTRLLANQRGYLHQINSYYRRDLSAWIPFQ